MKIYKKWRIKFAILAAGTLLQGISFCNHDSLPTGRELNLASRAYQSDTVLCSSQFMQLETS